MCTFNFALKCLMEWKIGRISVVRSSRSHMCDPEPVDNVEKHLSADISDWRRHCGCIRTSEKLKRILNKFPAPPPPPPTPLPNVGTNAPSDYKCPKLHASNYYLYPTDKRCTNYELIEEKKGQIKVRSTFWQIITEVVQLVQLSVTATALALYYIIYCYMQLVYYTLRSALYFHNADVPMKITIGVVTMTSLVVGMNILLRMERVIGFL